MAEKLEEFQIKNESLRKTIHNLEINLVNKEQDKETGKDDDCEEIEANSDKEIDCSEDTIEEAEAVLEVSENLNKCKSCDFIGQTEAGLKIHVTAKHKEKVSLFKMYRKDGTWRKNDYFKLKRKIENKKSNGRWGPCALCSPFLCDNLCAAYVVIYFTMRDLDLIIIIDTDRAYWCFDVCICLNFLLLRVLVTLSLVSAQGIEKTPISGLPLKLFHIEGGTREDMMKCLERCFVPLCRKTDMIYFKIALLKMADIS
jgi:hypothetical protein